MNNVKIIIVHFVAFIVVSTVFLLSSESLLALIAPGFHDVNMWIVLVIAGIIFLFIASFLSCILNLRKQKLKFKKTEA